MTTKTLLLAAAAGLAAFTTSHLVAPSDRARTSPAPPARSRAS